MSNPTPPGLGIQPLKKMLSSRSRARISSVWKSFFSCSGEDTGSASSIVENLYAGNVVFSYDPVHNPSRGALTFVRLTYNSMDNTSTSAGYGCTQVCGYPPRVRLGLGPVLIRTL
jgi:hypothetical protein